MVVPFESAMFPTNLAGGGVFVATLTYWGEGSSIFLHWAFLVRLFHLSTQARELKMKRLCLRRSGRVLDLYLKANEMAVVILMMEPAICPGADAAIG